MKYIHTEKITPRQLHQTQPLTTITEYGLSTLQRRNLYRGQNWKIFRFGKSEELVGHTRAKATAAAGK